MSEEKQEGRPGKVREWGEALFKGGFLSGGIAAISALFAIWSQAEASKAADRAARAKQALDQAQLAFQRERGDRSDQLVIYDRVEKQLGVSQPHGLVISSSYAQLVKDAQVRQVLCQTILAVAKDRIDTSEAGMRPRFAAAMGDVRQLLKDCVIEAAEEQRIDPQGRLAAGVPSGAAAGSGTVVQSQAPVTQVVSKALISPDGWDIDVFWCQSQGQPSRDLAGKIAQHLARASDTGRRISVPARNSAEKLGRIRLRSLAPAAQASLAPPSNVPVVVGSADEADFARALAAHVNGASGAGIRYSPTAATSQWYISFFACGFGKA